MARCWLSWPGLLAAVKMAGDMMKGTDPWAVSCPSRIRKQWAIPPRQCICYIYAIIYVCIYNIFMNTYITASGTLSFLLGVRCHCFPISTGSLIIFALVYLTMPAWIHTEQLSRSLWTSAVNSSSWKNSDCKRVAPKWCRVKKDRGNCRLSSYAQKGGIVFLPLLRRKTKMHV